MTGKITYVGKDYIEYDINTFNGCSGAAVALLDGAPEHQKNFGKCLAVHAGYKPALGSNLGFMVSGAFDTVPFSYEQASTSLSPYINPRSLDTH